MTLNSVKISHDLNIISEYHLFSACSSHYFFFLSASFRREYLNFYENDDGDEISLLKSDENVSSLIVVCDDEDINQKRESIMIVH